MLLQTKKQFVLPENQDKHYAALSSRGPLFFPHLFTTTQSEGAKSNPRRRRLRRLVLSVFVRSCIIHENSCWPFSSVPVLRGLLHTERSNLKMAAEVKEKKDAFEQGNPAARENQNALAEGIMQIFKPAVEELDDKVLSVRYSWVKLNIVSLETRQLARSVMEVSIYYREGRLTGLFESRGLRI